MFRILPLFLIYVVEYANITRLIMLKTVKATEVSEVFFHDAFTTVSRNDFHFPTQAFVHVFVYSMPTLRSTSVTMS